MPHETTRCSIGSRRKPSETKFPPFSQTFTFTVFTASTLLLEFLLLPPSNTISAGQSLASSIVLSKLFSTVPTQPAQIFSLTMPTRNSFSVFLLATALLGLCAVVHPMPTPSSQPPSLPATPPNGSQIAPRADNPNPPRQPSEPSLICISIGRLDVSLPLHMISLRSPRTGSPNEYDALRIGQSVYLDLISSYGLRIPYQSWAPTTNDYNLFQPLAKAYFGSEEEENAVFRNLRDPSWVREKCHMQEFLYKNIDYLVCIANWLKTSDYVKQGDRSRMSDRLDRYMADRTADLANLVSPPLRLPLMMARIRPDGSWVCCGTPHRE
ncbi:hypothetical protein F5878DRAFT_335163 [Lentinula raphanica]|uniref:Uncharacterized protein n=1 Tax=Lentinula raphanica TaxID=153919 RepID=A0AA38UAH5_9AGAR|nr:hypothetical protein F5878DRAFT_335163 [Lentinula raphanica]